MIVRSTMLVAWGLVVAVAAGGPVDDQQLIAQAAARGQPQPGAVPADSAGGQDLDEVERQARIDLLVSAARLDLVQARKALAAGRYVEAIQKARHALAAFEKLPAGVDVSVYELQAEGVIARATRLGGGQVLAGQNQPPDDLTRREMQAAGPQDPLEQRARAAKEVARDYTGADTRDIDTRVDTQALRARAARNQWPDKFGYQPGKEIFDTQAILARDQQRLYYEDALRTAYQSDEMRLLVEADEARVAPDRVVTYPDDWPEKVAKRAQYAGGVVYRSPSWYDQDGREWYMAVYDIHDLIYVPPDFQNIEGVMMNPAEGLRTSLDRQALRMYSQIFHGYPEDLAAGIPLLRYFGGVDDFEFRGPKYSLERQRQIVEMIEAFLSPRGPDPKVEAVAP